MSKNDGDFEIIGKDMLKVTAQTVKTVQILSEQAGKMATRNGEVRYVSPKDLKGAVKNIKGKVIVPVPEISGPIWNAGLAKMCKMDVENTEILYELFDDETKISSVRPWYYINLAKYILRTYILPLKRFSKAMGCELILDLGNIEMQYDLMKKMITIDVLKKSGLSLLVHKESGNVEKELGFSDNDFVMKGNVAEGVTKEDAKILLIKPTRGVMERFIQGEIKKRPNRLETPALLSAIESVYYCDMLTKRGHIFNVADETCLKRENDLKRYEHILICKSCLFTEREKKKIDKLRKWGIKINDSELIASLTEKGEN